MNELSKLISTLLLLGAGFVAASFVGPPELVGRLAEYLQPQSPVSSEGLRPLASNASAMRTDAWPALQRQPTPASAVSATTPAAEPNAESPWSSVAQVSAMVPPTSWSDDQRPAAPAAASTPSSGDWLTASSLDAPAAPSRYEPTPSVGKLTPVERGTASVPARLPASVPLEVAERAADWPELRAPRPPVDLSESLPRDTSGLRRLPPTSPYGERPSFEATSAAEPDWNPLRTEPQSSPIAPIGRQPAKATYTKHVVTDGDTLASLAERYLGEASRSGELFDLNRDRLEHPDVLPIGMVLLTPDTPQRSLQSQPPSAASFPSLRPETSDFATVSAYKPIEPTRDLTDRGRLTPINVTAERPLTEAQRLGPIDPHYDREVSWDANRW